jgi:putative endonuclease
MFCHSERSEESYFEVVGMYYVYILTNWSNKVLYTGVTNDLERRLYEHKTKLIKGFTAKYNTNILVYFDMTTDVKAAIEREKQIKGWTRSKKNDLIESMNPLWNDLSESLRL